MTDFEGETPFDCGDTWAAIDIDALRPDVQDALKEELRLLEEAHQDDEEPPIYTKSDAILSLLDKAAKRVVRKDVA